MDLTLALLGGDTRELVLANTLLKKGYNVKIYGLPKEELVKREALEKTVFAAVQNADVLLLPVKGVGKDGKLSAPLIKEELFLEEGLLKTLKPNATVLCGMATPYLTEHCERLGLKAVPLMERDEIAIPNAIPTAEGALAIAIEKTPVTIFGAKVVILGFGRVGRAVAKVFRHMGARVSVISRNGKEIEEGREMGYDVRQYRGLSAVLPHADIVINTVPAVVLEEQQLNYIAKNTLIIDLASLPGGVNKEAAEVRGISYVHALGLPGIYAPISAGKILALGVMEYLDGFRKTRW